MGLSSTGLLLGYLKGLTFVSFFFSAVLHWLSVGCKCTPCIPLHMPLGSAEDFRLMKIICDWFPQNMDKIEKVKVHVYKEF